jgi:hypothetical protein
MSMRIVVTIVEMKSKREERGREGDTQQYNR